MIIEIVDAGIHGVNTYLVADEATRKAVIIDPTGKFEKIKHVIEKNEFEPEYILLTHGHGDHIGAVHAIKDHYHCKIFAHHMEKEMLNDAKLNLSPLLGMGNIEFDADTYVHHDDEIVLEQLRFRVLHTPGHTKGSICLMIENTIFTGDTLFAGSMGRTDLPGGDGKAMVASLKTLKYLKGEYNIFPGHGPTSTLSKEKAVNPYLRNLS